MNGAVPNLASSDDDLFEQIARGLLGTPIAEGIVDDGDFPATIPVGLEALTDLRALGNRIFLRVTRELYDVICGSGKQASAERSKILHAAGLSEQIVFASLVGIISTTFGFAAGMCTAIATLVLRRIIKPAGDEVCKFWGEKFI